DDPRVPDLGGRAQTPFHGDPRTARVHRSRAAAHRRSIRARAIGTHSADVASLLVDDGPVAATGARGASAAKTLSTRRSCRSSSPRGALPRRVGALVVAVPSSRNTPARRKQAA